MAQQPQDFDLEYQQVEQKTQQVLERLQAGGLSPENMEQGKQILRGLVARARELEGLRKPATQPQMGTLERESKGAMYGIGLGIPSGVAGLVEGIAKLPTEATRNIAVLASNDPELKTINLYAEPLERERERLVLKQAAPGLRVSDALSSGTGKAVSGLNNQEQTQLAAIEAELAPLRERRAKAENRIANIYSQAAVPGTQPLSKVLPPIARGAQSVRETLEGFVPEPVREAVTYQAGQGLGQVLAAAPAGPGALPLLMSSSAGSGMEEARLSGALAQEALVYGAGGGLIEGATEKFGLGGRLPGYLSGAIKGRGMLRTGIREAVSEFPEEVAAYVGQTGLRQATFDPSAEITLGGALKAGTIGAVAGFGAGAAAGKFTTPAPGERDTLYTKAEQYRQERRRAEMEPGYVRPSAAPDLQSVQAFDDFRRGRVDEYETLRSQDPSLPPLNADSIRLERAETDDELRLEGLARELNTRIVWVNQPQALGDATVSGAFSGDKNIIVLQKGASAESMQAQAQAILFHELVHKVNSSDLNRAYDMIAKLDPEGLAGVTAKRAGASENADEAAAYYAEDIANFLDANLRDSKFDQRLLEENDLLDWLHDRAVSLYNRFADKRMLTAEQKRARDFLTGIGVESSDNPSLLDTRKKTQAARGVVEMLRTLTDAGQYESTPLTEGPELSPRARQVQAYLNDFDRRIAAVQEQPRQMYTDKLLADLSEKRDAMQAELQRLAGPTAEEELISRMQRTTGQAARQQAIDRNRASTLVDQAVESVNRAIDAQRGQDLAEAEKDKARFDALNQKAARLSDLAVAELEKTSVVKPTRNQLLVQANELDKEFREKKLGGVSQYVYPRLAVTPVPKRPTAYTPVDIYPPSTESPTGTSRAEPYTEAEWIKRNALTTESLVQQLKRQFELDIAKRTRAKRMATEQAQAAQRAAAQEKAARAEAKRVVEESKKAAQEAASRTPEALEAARQQRQQEYSKALMSLRKRLLEIGRQVAKNDAAGKDSSKLLAEAAEIEQQLMESAGRAVQRMLQLEQVNKNIKQREKEQLNLRRLLKVISKTVMTPEAKAWMQEQQRSYEEAQAKTQYSEAEFKASQELGKVFERAAAERPYQGPEILPQSAPQEGIIVPSVPKRKRAPRSEGTKKPTTPQPPAKQPKKKDGGIKYSRPDGRISAAVAFAGGGTVEIALADRVAAEVSVEYDAEIAQAYNANAETAATVSDIMDADIDQFVGKDFAHFSPPCVASSKLQAGTEVDRETETKLGKKVAEIIRLARNPIVMIENVPQYKDTQAFKAIEQALQDVGYNYDARIYKAEDYGSPSARARLMVRAVLSRDLPPVPQRTHGSGTQQPHVSWMDAIGGMLDTLPVMHQSGTQLPEYIQKALSRRGIDPARPGQAYYISGTQMYRDVPIKDSSSPAPTMLASGKETPRILMADGRVLRVTPEAMRALMGFGTEMKLPDNDRLAKRIIGNGVPKPLTRAVALPMLDGETAPQPRQEDFSFSRPDRSRSNAQERNSELRAQTVGIPQQLYAKIRSVTGSPLSIGSRMHWYFRRMTNRYARMYAISRAVGTQRVYGKRAQSADATLEDVVATMPGRNAQHKKFLYEEKFQELASLMNKGQVVVDGNQRGRPSLNRFMQAIQQPYRKAVQMENAINDLVEEGMTEEEARMEMQAAREAHIDALEVALEQTEDPKEIEAIKLEIRHLKEGRSFLSDEEAKAITDEALNGPAGEQYREILKIIEEVNNYTLDNLVKSGLRTKAWADNLRRRFGPHYTPFKDWPDSLSQASKHGERIPQKMFHMYEGRTTEARGTVEHLFSQSASVLHYAELNKARVALADALQSAMKVEKVRAISPKDVEEGKSLMPTVESASEVTQFFEPENNASVEPVKQEAMLFAKRRGTEPILYYRNGRPGWMVTTDPMLAEEILDSGIDTINAVSKLFSFVTRMRTKLLTQWVPDFLLGNFSRDLQAIREGAAIEYGEEFAKKYFGSRVPGAALKNWMQAYKTLAADINTPDPKQQQMRREFDESGARVAWVASKSFTDLAEELNRISRNGDGVNWLKKIGKPIERQSDLFENATRFMMFSAMRSEGASITRAAGAARRGTIDFTQRGTMAPLMNALYIFSSVNMTSIGRLISLMQRGTFGRPESAATGELMQPEGGRAARLGLAASSIGRQLVLGLFPRLLAYGYIAAMLADLVGGDDEETEQTRYSMLPPYQRTDYLNIGTGTDAFVTVPSPHGFRAVTGFGALLYNRQQDYMTEAEFSDNLSRLLFTAFSPFSGSTPLQALSPDVFKPLVESAENKNWFGAQVHPDLPPGVDEETSPAAYRAYEKTSGVAKATAEWLNSVTGGSRSEKGVIDVYPSTLEAYMNFFTGGVGNTAARIGKLPEKVLSSESKFGEDWTTNDIPLLRVLVKTVNREEWARRTYEARSKDARQALADEKEARKLFTGATQNLQRAKESGDRERISEAQASYDKAIAEARELYTPRQALRSQTTFRMPSGAMRSQTEAFTKFEREIDKLYGELKTAGSDAERKQIRQKITKLRTYFSLQMINTQTAN